MSDRFPGYDVLDKWSSVSFDKLTRAVLRHRLAGPPSPRFFDEAALATLEAAAVRLAPAPEGEPQPPIAAWIDAQLHEGEGEGYRFEGMPPTEEAWRRGVALISAESVAQYGHAFVDLDEPTQAAFLTRLQQGEVDDARWKGLDPKLFFKALLATVVGVYYAYPQGWSAMGFGGPASPRGYVRLGLNEHDPWEARESHQDVVQGSGG